MDVSSSSHDFWQLWSFEPGVLICLLLAALWYARGVHCIRRSTTEGSLAGRLRIGAAVAGLFTIVVALVSPLNALAMSLFSAHMVQHLLLVLVAAPLLVFAELSQPALRALPRGWRIGLQAWWTRGGAMQTIAHGVTAPAAAWLLHVGTLVFWHVPAPYGWAIRSDTVHAVEHLSFLATGVLFWWIALQPTGQRRLGYGTGILYVSSAGVVMGALGAILTFAPSPWYANHLLTTAAWQLTPLQDQQLAGVIMWAPSSLAYLAAASFLMVRWIGAEPARADTPRRAVGRVGWGPVVIVLASLGLFPLSACSADGGPYQTVAGGDVERGKRSIENYGCGSCHVVPGIRTAVGAVGPPLTAFGRRSFIAGALPNTVGSLIPWIENPQSIVPGRAMPNLGVTDRDARDIAAYLYTLR
jgi:cytochrome c oxidase assembly factor CtaG/cytochrome c2